MKKTLPRGRVVMTANDAAAFAVMLARVQAIGCYPITPQTLIVERLADLVAGRDDVEFANLESEHAMALGDAIEAEAQAQALCMQHPDFAEAHAAFKDKRFPKFKGAPE